MTKASLKLLARIRCNNNTGQPFNAFAAESASYSYTKAMAGSKKATPTPAARSPPPKSARQEVRQLRGELEDLLAAAEADDAAPAPVAQRR